MKKVKIKDLILEIIVIAFLIFVFVCSIVYLISCIKLGLTHSLIIYKNESGQCFIEEGEIMISQYSKHIAIYTILSFLSLAALGISIYFLVRTLSPKLREREERTKEERDRIKQEKKAQKQAQQSAEAEAQKQKEIAELEKRLEELKKDDN